MPTDLIVECARCMYWVEAIPGDGDCHRYPKIVEFKGGDDFCGEFTPESDGDDDDLDSIEAIADYFDGFYRNDSGGCFAIDMEEDDDEDFEMSIDTDIGHEHDYPYL